MAKCLNIEEMHQLFVRVLPRIETHARIYFRHVRCWHRREDFVQETIAVSWKWFRRLIERGKDPTRFISTLASLAARSVKCGRKAGTKEKAGDTMSSEAQRKHGFVVGKLPDMSTLSDNPLSDALHDNTQTEVPEQVSFRIDFPAWVATHSHRNRDIIGEMMLHTRTQELARRFRLSEARISQMRRELMADWELFIL